MARIPAITVEQIKERADILDVVSEVVRLRRRGRNYFGLCPFHHEKTPSFSVNPSMGIFHCFGCGKGGNAVTFVMEYEKVDYVEALKRLAERYSIPIEWEKSANEKKGDIPILYELQELALAFYQKQLYSADGRAALEYMHGRGFEDALLKELQVGFAPAEWDRLLRTLDRSRYTPALLEKSGLFVRREENHFYDRFRNRILFPIHNLSGRVIAFGGRTLDPNENAKYLNSPESPIYFKSGVLYGLHIAKTAIRRAEEAILIEGYTDFLRFYSQGIQNVVAGSGTALTFHHAKILKRFTNQALLCYDGDDAGQKAAERAGFILLREGLDVRVIVLPAEDDPDSYLANHTPEDFQQLRETAPDFISFYIENHRSELQTHATKTAFIEQLVAELVGIQNPVTRDLIIRELAEQLRVNEEAVRAELRRASARGRQRPQRRQEEESPEKSIEIKTAVERAEFELLKVLLAGKPVYENIIRHNLGELPLRHAVLGKITKVLLDRIGKGESVSPDSLFDLEWNSDEQFYLSRLLMESETFIEKVDHKDLIQLLQDCITAMQTWDDEQQIGQLRDQIRAAEKKGEDPGSLLQQLVACQKRIRETTQEIRSALENISEAQ